MSQAELVDDDVPVERPVAVLRGQVMRAWRRHGLPTGEVPLRRLAGEVGVPYQTLQSWEAGHRDSRPGRNGDLREVLRRSGRLLTAGDHEPQVLPAVAAAAGTPSALPERHRWEVNFEVPGEPCWVWMRTAGAGLCTVELAWGRALSGTALVGPGPSGLFIQFPTCVRNPPLELTMSVPGWVDAGPGTVPERIARQFGAQWVRASQVHRARQVLHRRWSGAVVAKALRQLTQEQDALRATALREEFGIRWELVVPHLAEVLLPMPAHSLDFAEVGIPSGVEGSAPEPDRHGRYRQLTLAPERLKRLREVRGFGQEQAAAHASSPEMTALPQPERSAAALTRQSIQRLESGGALPRAELALARLDVLYEADGRLGVETVYDSRADDVASTSRLSRTRCRHSVAFPPWWRGPVWLKVEAPSGGAPRTVMQTTWGPWTRRTPVVSGQVVTTRQAPVADGVEPVDRLLLVDVPHGWRLRAGTGAVGSADDIGGGWRPVDLTAIKQVVRESLDSLQQASRMRRG